MKERIEHILGNNEAREFIYRHFSQRVARIPRAKRIIFATPTAFTIYDTDDAKSVVKTVIGELNIDDKMYKPNHHLQSYLFCKECVGRAQNTATIIIFQQEDILLTTDL